jgi:hypothetical protein
VPEIAKVAGARVYRVDRQSAMAGLYVQYPHPTFLYYLTFYDHTVLTPLFLVKEIGVGFLDSLQHLLFHIDSFLCSDIHTRVISRVNSAVKYSLILQT